MLSIYPAYFVKDETGYTVIFPDWGGVASFGSDINEAMTMAIDCLAGLIFNANIEGAELPKPSAINELSAIRFAEENECSVNDVSVQLVSVNAEVYAREHFQKCVKKTITILEWQNREGMKRGINFSKICQDALTAALTK